MAIFASIVNGKVAEVFVAENTGLLPPGEYVEGHANVYVGCPYAPT